MLVLAVCLLTIAGFSNGLSFPGASGGLPYVPGTPGSSWTLPELKAVRGQLTAIFRNPTGALFKVPGGPVSFLQGKVPNWQSISGRQIYERYAREIPSGIQEFPSLQDQVLPNVAKFVRLTFHDCIKDTETGGCNGCLNFRNMGVETRGRDCLRTQSCALNTHEKVTDNNNLLWVARVLEILYTEKNPPFSRAKDFQLDTSLRDSGKSRADLWAYAGLVAMETGSQTNNIFCRGGTGLCPGQFDENSPSCKHCLPTLTFKTGRADCIPTCTGADSFYGFCSTANEIHPNPLGNGESVTQFFRNTFDFTPRESIAIMGAHTFGHAHEQISQFRHYAWTKGFKRTLNNNFYKQMAEPGMYRAIRNASPRQKCNLKLSNFQGDEYGNPISTIWQPRSQFLTNDGGPWNWNPFGLKCDPAKCGEISASQMSKASCCRLFGAEGNNCINSGAPQDDDCKFVCFPEVEDCSKAQKFLTTSYLQSDMGLFLKFGIDGATGRPTGCSGLNSPQWLANKWREPMNPHGCPLNDAMDGSGLKMHEIVELFARNQQTWIDEFVPVFAKMQENGYASGALTAAPSGWEGLICNNRKCQPFPFSC